MNLIPPNVKLANSSNFYDTTIDTVTRANIFSTAGLQAIQDFLEDFCIEHNTWVSAITIYNAFKEFKGFKEFKSFTYYRDKVDSCYGTLDDLRDNECLLPINDWENGFILVSTEKLERTK